MSIPVESTNFCDEINDGCVTVLEANPVTTTEDGGELGVQTIEIAFPQLAAGEVRAYPKTAMPALSISTSAVGNEPVAAGTIGHNYEIEVTAVIQSGDVRDAKEDASRLAKAAAVIVQSHIRGDTGQFLASQHQVGSDEAPRSAGEPVIDGYTVTARWIVPIQVLQSVPVLGGFGGFDG